jgi:hypothetical protein
MTLAIAHKEGETEILDLIRERRAPFSPEAVVASTMLRYRCHTCYGDRYAGEWPVEQFSKAGVHLEPAEKIKSDIYLDLLPLINSKAVRLLDHERMMLQLVGLERSTKSGGRDKIDHPRGLHDDVANAAAGALVFAYQGISYSPGQRLRDDLKLQAGGLQAAGEVACLRILRCSEASKGAWQLRALRGRIRRRPLSREFRCSRNLKSRHVSPLGMISAARCYASLRNSRLAQNQCSLL